MTIKGWVVFTDGKPVWYRAHTGDEVFVSKRKAGLRAYWRDIRRATVIIEEPKKRRKRGKV